MVEAFFVSILFKMSSQGLIFAGSRCTVLPEISELTKEVSEYPYSRYISLVLPELWFGMAIAKFSTTISDWLSSVRMSDLNVEYLIDRK